MSTPLAAGSLYPPSRIKRARRTRAEMDSIREAIVELLRADNPQTVRQVFYALTVRGIVAKTEAEYKETVVRLLTEMRRTGRVPYGWIADNTRWIRKPISYNGLADFLRKTAQLYRRDLWAGADIQIEIWCEKDALAGVLIEETEKWDVPLYVSRGFSSDTYLESAAQTIRAGRKPAYIYQFGDHDPSGIWIAKTIEQSLRRYAPDAEIYFKRVAVTPDQISAWSLPTRPTKREGNTHACGFEGESVELDAIPAEQLRELVRGCIERHVNYHRLAVVKEAEQSEYRLLADWAGGTDEGRDPGAEGWAEALRQQRIAELWNGTQSDLGRIAVLDRLKELAGITNGWAAECCDLADDDRVSLPLGDIRELRDTMRAAIAAIEGSRP